MLQLLVAGVIVLALLLLAASSFRLQQRALGSALLLLALAMSATVSWVVLRQNTPPPAVDVANLALHLNAVHPTANGWRVEGEVTNTGATDISSMTLAAVALDCNADGVCSPVGRRQFDLLLNVPAGKQYPVRYPLDDFIPPVQGELQWQLEAVSAVGYAGHP